MPTIQLLGLAQRAREDYTIQAAFAPIQRSPAPQPSAASEWNFVDSAQQNFTPDSDSKSSQSFSSSEDLEGATIMPSRSSYPYYTVQVVRETEPTRLFSQACIAETESESHCTLHCDDLVCKRRVYLDSNCAISYDCHCVSLSVPPANISLEALDILATQESHADAREEDQIMVYYPAALEIIQRFRNKGHLDLWHFLLRSPSYTKSTIHTPTRHATAAKAANSFILNGMEDALNSICSLSNNQWRVITVQELETSLETTLRLDCVAWAEKWVCRGEKNITWNWFTTEMRKSEGLKVLVEKAREYVRDVVGALVWWDMQRREVEEVEHARRKALLLVLNHMATETEQASMVAVRTL
jgi:hypothetical protein